MIADSKGTATERLRAKCGWCMKCHRPAHSDPAHKCGTCQNGAPNGRNYYCAHWQFATRPSAVCNEWLPRPAALAEAMRRRAIRAALNDEDFT